MSFAKELSNRDKEKEELRKKGASCKNCTNRSAACKHNVDDVCPYWRG